MSEIQGEAWSYSQEAKAWNIIVLQNLKFPFDILVRDPDELDPEVSTTPLVREVVTLMIRKYKPEEPRCFLPVIEVKIPQDPKERGGVTPNKGDMIVGWIWSGKEPTDVVL